ncbi:MAG: rod shape-determining protein MreD [Alkalicoccus sp.]|nr:MAG: rod shape-determining protein MreD [Alkalicoccus sp.]
MSRLLLPLTIFILFIIEGTVFQIFSGSSHQDTWYFIPYFMLMLVILTGIFRGRSHGLFYGIFFGLLYDIVYGSVLGIYTFGMGLTAYIFSISAAPIKRSLRMLTVVILGAVIALEYYLYGMMSLLGMTGESHGGLFLTRFLPTFIINGIVAALIVSPVRYWFYTVDGRDDGR